jgi:hypothetical protein
LSSEIDCTSSILQHIVLPTDSHNDAESTLERASRTVMDHPDFDSHETVLFATDRRAKLRAVIAIHDTSLGPALCGVRMYPYATEEAALTDVLRLSRGMTYKNAMAGLLMGGGQGVIIGNPSSDRTGLAASPLASNASTKHPRHPRTRPRGTTRRQRSRRLHRPTDTGRRPRRPPIPTPNLNDTLEVQLRGNLQRFHLTF